MTRGLIAGFFLMLLGVAHGYAGNADTSTLCAVVGLAVIGLMRRD